MNNSILRKQYIAKTVGGELLRSFFMPVLGCWSRLKDENQQGGKGGTFSLTKEVRAVDEQLKEKSIAELEKELTAQQVRFVKELVANGGNATEAAISAGYAVKNAASQASRLLRNEKVLAYRKAYASAIYEGLGITAQSLALELEEIKRRCLEAEPHMIWDAGAREWVPDGTWLFNAKGAIAAIKMQAEIMGIAAPKKVKVDGEVRNQSLEEFLKSLGNERVF